MAKPNKNSNRLKHKFFQYSLLGVVTFLPLAYGIYTSFPPEKVDVWLIIPLLEVEYPRELLPSPEPGFKFEDWFATTISELAAGMMAVSYYISGILGTVGLFGFVAGLSSNYIAGSLGTFLNLVHLRSEVRLFLKLYGSVILVLVIWLALDALVSIT